MPVLTYVNLCSSRLAFPADCHCWTGERRPRRPILQGPQTQSSVRRLRKLICGARPPQDGEILLTSMDRDGTRQGFDIALTRSVADAARVPVIASGGVGPLDHPGAGIPAGP